MGPPTLKVLGNLIQPNLPNVMPIDYVVETYLRMAKMPVDPKSPFKTRLILLEAKTASGKSVTVPPTIYIAFKAANPLSHKIVLCTQPRVLTAIELVTKDINNAPYFTTTFKLGENLGYKTGSFTEGLGRTGGLLFATLGSFEQTLQNMSVDHFCSTYAAIIIDEAHERQLIFDSTIAILKSYYERNSTRDDLPVIIMMSATFDIEKYAVFFGIMPPTSGSGEIKYPDGVIRVAGASYPIEERWPESGVSDIHTGAVEAIIKCVEEETLNLPPERLDRALNAYADSDNRVLVFVPGLGNSKKINKLLAETGFLTGKPVPGPNGTIVQVTIDYMYVDSAAVRTVSKDYLRVTGTAENRDLPQFKIAVICVNAVAETGLSLPDLRYVIDCGWSKESEFCPTLNIRDLLISKPAAQSRIMQRRGRVGRKKNGIFIPLYTRATFDALDKIQTPEILKVDPTIMLLRIANINGRIGTQEELSKLLLDVPTEPAVVYSIHKLQLLGMLDESLSITPMGRTACLLGDALPIESIAMIMAGLKWDVLLDDLIVIASMMQCSYGKDSPIGHSQEARDDLRARSMNKKLAPDERRRLKSELQRSNPTAQERELIYATLWGYQGINNKRSIYYPFRAMVADDFIEQLVIFRAFEKRWGECLPVNSQSSGGKTPTPTQLYQSMLKWAKSCFLNLPVLLDAYEKYINVRDKLCLGGLDVSAGSQEKSFCSIFPAISSTTPPEVADAQFDLITRIKLCIFHGFKMNLADRLPNGDYRMIYGGYTFSWSFFGTDYVWKKYDAPYNYAPQRIIFYQSRCMSQQLIYRVTIAGISVLDGYI